MPAMTKADEENIYLRMPLIQVKEDALLGVYRARLAYAERQPDQARLLGFGISPKEQRSEMVKRKGAIEE